MTILLLSFFLFMIIVCIVSSLSEDISSKDLYKILGTCIVSKPKITINYYSITLGITKSASINQVKQAYRKLAKIYHPDKLTGNDKIGNKRFQEIAVAYEVLSKVDDRRKYDCRREIKDQYWDYVKSQLHAELRYQQSTYSDSQKDRKLDLNDPKRYYYDNYCSCDWGQKFVFISNFPSFSLRSDLTYNDDRKDRKLREFQIRELRENLRVEEREEFDKAIQVVFPLSFDDILVEMIAILPRILCLYLFDFLLVL